MNALQPYGQYYGLGQFPNPVEWVKEKVKEFFALPLRIGAAQRRAGQLRAIAREKGLTDAAAQLAQVEGNLTQMSSEHASVAGRVRSLLETLGKLGVKVGLGAIPLAVLAAAAVVATAMAAIMANVYKQERLLSAIEKGVVTPAEAERLGKAPLLGINLGPLVPLLVIGGGLWFFGPQLARALRRGRRR